MGRGKVPFVPRPTPRREPTREEQLEADNQRLQGLLTKSEAENTRLKGQVEQLLERDPETEGVNVETDLKPSILSQISLWSGRRKEVKKLDQGPGETIDWFEHTWEELFGPVAEGDKANFAQVMEAVKSELDHLHRIGYLHHERPTWICLLEHYLLKARDDLCCAKKPEGDEMDQIRKVVALGFKYMMQYGAPRRVKSKAHPIPGQPDKHEPR